MGQEAVLDLVYATGGFPQDAHQDVRLVPQQVYHATGTRVRSLPISIEKLLA